MIIMWWFFWVNLGINKNIKILALLSITLLKIYSRLLGLPCWQFRIALAWDKLADISCRIFFIYSEEFLLLTSLLFFNGFLISLRVFCSLLRVGQFPCLWWLTFFSAILFDFRSQPFFKLTLLLKILGPSFISSFWEFNFVFWHLPFRAIFTLRLSWVKILEGQKILLELQKHYLYQRYFEYFILILTYSTFFHPQFFFCHYNHFLFLGMLVLFCLEK